MVATYLINNFSLNIQEYSYEPEVIELCKIIKEDYTCFRILNDFFVTTTNPNGISVEQVALYLDNSKETFEIMENQTVNLKIYENLKETIIKVFNDERTSNHYWNICSNYVEYIVNMWKKIPDPNGILASEPQIFYNSQLMFNDCDYCNSKFDIVYLHKINKQFNLYECKFKLRTFLSDLKYTSSNTNTKKQRKHEQSIRKKQYMTAFHNLFENKQIDTNEGEVAIVTLANRTAIENDLSILYPLKIYTREDLENKSVFDSFYI